MDAAKPVSRRKVLTGKVISAKMEKTLVVSVETIKTYEKYHKQYKVTDKFKVDDPLKMFKAGDKVSFTACRPISKDKKWRVIYPKKSK